MPLKIVSLRCAVYLSKEDKYNKIMIPWRFLPRFFCLKNLIFNPFRALGREKNRGSTQKKFPHKCFFATTKRGG